MALLGAPDAFIGGAGSLVLGAAPSGRAGFAAISLKSVTPLRATQALAQLVIAPGAPPLFATQASAQVVVEPAPPPLFASQASAQIVTLPGPPPVLGPQMSILAVTYAPPTRWGNASIMAINRITFVGVALMRLRGPDEQERVGKAFFSLVYAAHGGGLPLPNPTRTPGVGISTGGTGQLAPGTYRISFTWLDGYGQTQVGPTISVVLTAPNSSIQLGLAEMPPPGAVAGQAYISQPNDTTGPMQAVGAPLSVDQLLADQYIDVAVPLIAASGLAASNYHANNADPDWVNGGCEASWGDFELNFPDDRDVNPAYYLNCGGGARPFYDAGQINSVAGGYTYMVGTTEVHFGNSDLSAWNFQPPVAVDAGTAALPAGSPDATWPEQPAHADSVTNTAWGGGSAGDPTSESAFLDFRYTRPLPPSEATANFEGIYVEYNAAATLGGVQAYRSETGQPVTSPDPLVEVCGAIYLNGGMPFPNLRDRASPSLALYLPLPNGSVQRLRLTYGSDPNDQPKSGFADDAMQRFDYGYPPGSVAPWGQGLNSNQWDGGPQENVVRLEAWRRVGETSTEAWIAASIVYRFTRAQWSIDQLEQGVNPPATNTTGYSTKYLDHDYADQSLNPNTPGTLHWDTKATQMIVVRSGDVVANVGPFQNTPGAGTARVWSLGYVADATVPLDDASGRHWFEVDYDDSPTGVNWPSAAGGFQTDLVYATNDRGTTLYNPHWKPIPTAPPITYRTSSGGNAAPVDAYEANCFRQAWTQPAGKTYDGRLSIRYNGRLVAVYINGVQLNATVSTYSYFATAEFDVSATLLRAGKNVLAIHVSSVMLSPDRDWLYDGTPTQNMIDMDSVWHLVGPDDMGWHPPDFQHMEPLPTGRFPYLSTNFPTNDMPYIWLDARYRTPYDARWRTAFQAMRPDQSTRMYWQHCVFEGFGHGTGPEFNGPGFFGFYGNHHVPDYEVYSDRGGHVMPFPGWQWLPADFGFYEGDVWNSSTAKQPILWGFVQGDRVMEALAGRYAGSMLGYMFGGGWVGANISMTSSDERAPGVSYLLSYGIDQPVVGYRERTVYNSVVELGYPFVYSKDPPADGMLIAFMPVNEKNQGLLDVYVSISCYSPDKYPLPDARMAFVWYDKDQQVGGLLNPTESSSGSAGGLAIHGYSETTMFAASESAGATGNWQDARYVAIWAWAHEDQAPTGVWEIVVTVRENAAPRLGGVFAAVLG